MRIAPFLVYSLLTVLLGACSGVEIEHSPLEKFSAGHYQYYKWRTEALPTSTRSTDPLYAIDPIVRRDVDAELQSKGYVLDDERAQFTVGYMFSTGMLQGERSELASNISPYPMSTANRRFDQATVDNAIALGGVKETDNIVVRFNDRASNSEVWQVTLMKIVEDVNSTDTSNLEKNLRELLARALRPLPPATPH
jgi:hypothetical protein